MSRIEERWGLACIDDCVDMSIQRLKDYINISIERLITVANFSSGTDKKSTKTKKITMSISSNTMW